MPVDSATIQTIQRDSNGDLAARFTCSASLIPAPGRYTLAYHPGQPDTALGQHLYQVGIPTFLDNLALPFLGPIPDSWRPGEKIHLRRPFGRGFRIPKSIRRLALAALGDTPARLLPTIPTALENGTSIAFFTPVPEIAASLPPAVEIHPISALNDILTWADFLAVDIPLKDLANLRTILNLGPHNQIPCAAQALIWTPMPCGAIADCGACAVPTRTGAYKLACKDGPVFDLQQIVW